MRKNFIIMAVVALMASSGGYYMARFLDSTSGPGPAAPGLVAAEAMPALSANDLVGQRRPDFTLNDVRGMPVSARDFDGSILLVNFWATWCTPCVEEMPMLSQLQLEYAGQGVKIVGIALDDADRASEFAEDLELSYPVLFGLADVVLTGRRYGNNTGMLPFSVLIDASGIIRWTRLGALTKKELVHQIQALK